jgi:flavin-dependent dehydrogenase
MSTLQRDLVIVGGGPIGLVTGILAAQDGMSVTLLESRADPIDKACGEGLMPRAIERLAEITVDPIGRNFDGITYLDAAGGRRVYAPFQGSPGRGVQRIVLHEALTLRAKEVDVQRRQGRVVRVSQDGGSATAHCADGVAFMARYLVGADGLHSTVRREIGLATKSRKHARYGLRQHFLTKPWSTSVEVYWAPESEAYVTPVSDDVVGVAILGGRGSDPFDARIAAFPALTDRLGDARKVGTVLGAGPLRQVVKGRVRGRVLLVGDAAGYVDALTGEGLAVGFASAHALVGAIQRGRPTDYERDWRLITRHYRWLTQSLVASTRHRSVRRLVVPTAARLPKAFSAAVNSIA